VIRALVRRQDGQTGRLPPEELATALTEEHCAVWVDIADEPREVSQNLLRATFGFHPLAVDDALEEVHGPKVDDWGGYIYLVLHAVVYQEQSSEPLDTLELDVFLGANYLVTYQKASIATVDRVWVASEQNEHVLERGAVNLLYTLADELVVDYMPVVEAIDEAIDRIEDRVFRDPSREMLEQIFRLKRTLVNLRRVIAPQQEVLNKLARGDYAVIDPDDRVLFRDVYDHLVRLHSLTEGLRDLAGNALEIYLSALDNRLNDIVKTLTLITTLFMPLSFLAGFFGMNFFAPVEPSLNVFTDVPVFVITIAAMIMLPIGMYAWMRRRAWL
jgi:magnesium transporter